MSDETLFPYRLMTNNGLVIDFTSPNPIASMWMLVRGEGYFSMRNHEGVEYQRVPFHAISSLAYYDPQQAAFAYAPAASPAKN